MVIKRGQFFFLKNRRGQIWVETVIYTLIAFALMGLVLAFVIPKVEELRDKSVAEQSVGILRDMDSLISGLGDPGNQRILELGLNRGTLTIDGVNEKIVFVLEGSYQYSQPGENVTVGEVIVNTESQNDIYIITMTLDYQNRYNIMHEDKDEEKVLTPGSVPYKISISDRGMDSNQDIKINFEVIG